MDFSKTSEAAAYGHHYFPGVLATLICVSSSFMSLESELAMAIIVQIRRKRDA